MDFIREPELPNLFHVTYIQTHSSVLIYIPKEKDIENQICRKQNWKKKWQKKKKNIVLIFQS